jgi:hypothetical protein
MVVRGLKGGQDEPGGDGRVRAQALIPFRKPHSNAPLPSAATPKNRTLCSSREGCCASDRVKPQQDLLVRVGLSKIVRFHSPYRSWECHSLAGTQGADIAKRQERGSMYKLSSRVRTTHGQDGAVVLDIRQGQMFNLNLVGSRILELVKNGTDERAIVEKVGVEFDVPRDTAEHDVREFIHVLRERRLIEDLAFESQENEAGSKS